MEKFIYNIEHTRRINYFRWKQMNDKERFYYKQDPLAEEKAMKLFDKMHPKIDNNNWSYDANGSPIEDALQ
jgi:hypothetical protein